MANFAPKKIGTEKVSEEDQEHNITTTKSLLDRVSNNLETLNLQSHVVDFKSRSKLRRQD